MSTVLTTDAAVTTDAAATTDPRPTRRQAFRLLRHSRPVVGALLLVLAGVEMFLSTQLDLGNIRIQMGIEGFQATLIPILLVVLGVLVFAMPVHHVFYGVIALVIGVYSIVGVNLGGFFVGMLLAAVGGVLAVAWMPPAAAARQSDAEAPRAVAATAPGSGSAGFVAVPGGAEFVPYTALSSRTYETVTEEPRPFVRRRR